MKQHKAKLCPVMEKWSLNHYVDVFMANTVWTIEEMLEWIHTKSLEGLPPSKPRHDAMTILDRHE